MRYLKILGLTVAAATTLVALFASGSAQASVLCSTTTTPCNSKWPAGTVIHLTQKTGTSLKIVTTEGETLDTCTDSTIKFDLDRAGSSTQTPGGRVTVLIFGATGSPCTLPWSVLSLGQIEIHHISGSDNGTLTGMETEFTINTIFFGSCVYGYGAGTDIGTALGGSPATFVINAVLSKLSGSSLVCPPTVRLTGEWVLTQPSSTTFDVEPS